MSYLKRATPQNEDMFRAALERFGVEAERDVVDAFVRCTELVQTSLLDGLPELTGAPGQPVITGNLKNSFVPEFIGTTGWQITSKVAYAEYVEDGANDRAFFNPARTPPRSLVGGYHSKKLTEASWDRIVDTAAREIAERKSSAATTTPESGNA